MRGTKLLIAIAVVCTARTGISGIVLDQSPAVWGTAPGTTFLNHSSGQNFSDRVSFGTVTEIWGMDIYGIPIEGDLGKPVTVRIWADNSGEPGALHVELALNLSLVDGDGAVDDFVRKHADFTSPFVFEAGVPYWIGMSATDTPPNPNPIEDISQILVASVPSTGDGRVARMHSTSLEAMMDRGDMAFRLHDSIVAVPENAVGVPAAAAVGMVVLAVMNRTRGRGERA